MEFLKTVNLELKKDLDQFKFFFNKFSEAFDLEKKWSNSNALKNEITKSYLRGLIRESNFSKRIILNTLLSLKKLNFFENEIYITKVYPMIHLKEDYLEAGNFHNDQIGSNQMYTCWIPFTNYDYSALSFTCFKSRNFIFINKVLNKLKLIKFFSKNIFVKKNEIYIWDAQLFHRGNFNNSENISCAIQFKITKEPFLYERNKKIDFTKSLDNFDYENELIQSNDQKILKDFENYFDLVHNILKIKSDEEFNLKAFKLLKKIKNNKIISFALSVLSQRLTLMPNIDNNDYQNIYKYIDMASLLLGSENLISLERVKYTQLFKSLYYGSKINTHFNLPDDCIQWNTILNNNISKFEKNRFYF